MSRTRDALTKTAKANSIKQKNITINIPTDLLEKIDNVVATFNEQSKVGSISRTDFMLTAARNALEDIKQPNNR